MKINGRPTPLSRQELYAECDVMLTKGVRRVRWKTVRLFAIISIACWVWAIFEIGHSDIRYSVATMLGLVPGVAVVILRHVKSTWAAFSGLPHTQF